MRNYVLSTCPIVLPLFLACTVTADEPAPQRWAIVTADASLVKVSELLTAELSRLDGVTLVERDEIQKVLGELQLAAAGLVEAEKSLKLGQTLSAEAILLVDVVKENRAMARARLIETRTGVRLWDWTGLVQKPDQQAATIAGELKTSRAKLAVPDERRRYVGVIGMHTEEAGGALDAVASALGALLEFDLQSSPEIVVLEREQLGQLQKERDLTGLELKLRTAAVLLEGAIRRDGEGSVVTLRQTSLSGAAAQDVRLELPSQNANELRGPVVKAATKLLGSSGVNASASPEQEATALLARVERVRAAGRNEDAVGLAEAAYALMPSTNNRDALQMTLGFAVYAENNDVRRIKDKSERERRWITLTQHAIRLCDVDSLRSRELQAKSPTVPLAAVAFQPEIEHAGDDMSEELRTLQRELYQVQAARSRQLLDQHRSTRHRFRLLAERIRAAPRLTTDSDEYCRDLERLVADLADTFAQHGGASGDFAMVLKELRQAVYHSTEENRTFNSGPAVRRWPVAKLADTFRTLARHPHPVIAMAGLEGAMRISGDEGRDAAIRLLKFTLMPSLDHFLEGEIGGLRLVAGARLKVAGAPPPDVDELLTRAGRTPNRTEAFHCLRTAWTLQFFDRRYPPEFFERLIALIDAGEWNDAERITLRDIRTQAVTELTRLDPKRSVAAVAVATGPWSQFEETQIKIDRPKDDGQLLAFGVDRSAAAKTADEELVLSYSQRFGQVSVERLSIRGGS